MASTPAVPAVTQVVQPAAPEWVVFACDGHYFAVPLARVREILTPRPLTRMPGCGREVCGLIGLRGRVVTVFDLAAALGLRSAIEVPEHQLLLVAQGERIVAFAVDQVVGVAVGAMTALPLPGAALRALDIDREDLLGIGALGDRAFVAIDPDRILARLLA